jgi:hypothetical protein
MLQVIQKSILRDFILGIGFSEFEEISLSKHNLLILKILILLFLLHF